MMASNDTTSINHTHRQHFSFTGRGRLLISAGTAFYYLILLRLSALLHVYQVRMFP
jgi:hypothetical protein